MGERASNDPAGCMGCLSFVFWFFVGSLIVLATIVACVFALMLLSSYLDGLKNKPRRSASHKSRPAPGSGCGAIRKRLLYARRMAKTNPGKWNRWVQHWEKAEENCSGKSGSAWPAQSAEEFTLRVPCKLYVKSGDQFVYQRTTEPDERVEILRRVDRRTEVEANYRKVWVFTRCIHRNIR